MDHSGVIQFNGLVHHIRSTTISAWLDREYPERPLVTMYDSDAGNWVIAEWVTDEKFATIHIIGPSLGLFDRAGAAEVHRLLRTPAAATLARVRKYGLERQRASRRANSDQWAMSAEVTAWARKKFGPNVPPLFAGRR